MKKLCSVICAFVFGIGWSIPLFAADTETHIDVSLRWDANTERDLACYKVYRSTVSGEYGASVATLPKDQTNYILAIAREITDRIHFFTLTACDLAGNESGKSNELSKLIAAIPTIPTPGMPVLTVTSTVTGEVTVTWSDVPDGRGGIAKVNIRYGIPPILWGSLPSALCETSPCKISELLPDTLYGVKGVAYRADATRNIFGTITTEVQVRTLGVIDFPPDPPKGIIIGKEEENEVQLLALVENCRELTTSAIGSSDEIHKLSVKCVK